MSEMTQLTIWNGRPVLVPFRGGALSAVRDEQGLAYMALRPACEALGLNEEGQHQRLERAAWATACIMQAVGADGKHRQMYCLRSDRVAMWLATVDVRRVKPELRERLVVWQCEAASALDGWARGEGARTESTHSIREMVRKEVAVQLGAKRIVASPSSRVGKSDLAVLSTICRLIGERKLGPVTAIDLMHMLDEPDCTNERRLLRRGCIRGRLNAHRLGNWLARMRRWAAPQFEISNVARSELGAHWRIRPSQPPL